MEHRLGQRLQVNVPIRLTAPHLFLVRSGQLRNLSVSGGWIVTEADLRVLSAIQVAVDLPIRTSNESPAQISAHIARKVREGIGVEWSTLAPAAVGEFLRAATARRYVPTEWSDQIARLSAPPFKHGR